MKGTRRKWEGKVEGTNKGVMEKESEQKCLKL